MKKEEYILCAAVHFQDGIEYVHQPKNIESGFVICGRRHHNCFTTKSIFNTPFINSEQGFLTSKDRFVDREEARKIAIDCGQITETMHSTKLFSEDLY